MQWIGNEVLKRTELLRKHKTGYIVQAIMNEGVDPSLFIASTYLAVDPKDFGISGDAELRLILESIEREKFVLTNNPEPFARSILSSLGVDDLFKRIIGYEGMKYMPKPKLEAFQVISEAIRLERAVVYLDDNLSNIQAAYSLGAATVFVGECDQSQEIPEYSMHSQKSEKVICAK